MSNLSDYIDALRLVVQAAELQKQTDAEELLESILDEVNTALDGAPILGKVAIDTENFSLVSATIFATGYHLNVTLKPKSDITKKLIRLVTFDKVYTINGEKYKFSVKTAANDVVTSVTITQDSSWT